MSEKNKSIGALWLKEGKNGKFMSGSIEIEGRKHNFVVFKNSYKEQDKQPDYKIFEAMGQKQQQDEDIPF